MAKLAMLADIQQTVYSDEMKTKKLKLQKTTKLLIKANLN